MNTPYTPLKFFSITLSLAIAGLLALPLSESGWLMAAKNHRGPVEEEIDWTLSSRENTAENEVDWTLAKTESEEDETDWTLA